MNDKSSATTKSGSASKAAEGDTVQAGVSAVENKEAIAASKETKDDAAVLPADETIVEKLPENGAVLNTVTSQVAADAFEAAKTGGVYADEFAGQGGTFIVDGETGERKRAHVEVTDEKGKTVGFRPIP